MTLQTQQPSTPGESPKYSVHRISPRTSASAPVPNPTRSDGKPAPLVVAVMFIGGVSVGELAAIRWLSTHLSTPERPVRIVTLTTDVCNGDAMLQHLA